MSDLVNVGVAELKIAGNSSVLASYGLGSCVAVAMFDPLRKIGGLAHVMLPESRGKEIPESSSGKFADQAVPRLVEELTRAGARKSGLRCKIVGGAQMFEMAGSQRKEGAVAYGPPAHIGARNVEAVKKELDRLKIPLVGEDTGGNYGRTVRFNSSSGDIEVNSINHGRTTL